MMNLVDYALRANPPYYMVALFGLIHPHVGWIRRFLRRNPPMYLTCTRKNVIINILERGISKKRMPITAGKGKSFIFYDIN